MARPPLPIGTHGEINTRRETPEDVKPASWRAYCRYRHNNGKTTQVERWGTNENKAKSALRSRIKDLQGSGSPRLSSASRVKHAAAIYRERYTKKRRGTSTDTTMSWLDNWVLPALGDLLIRECDAGRLTTYFESLETAKTKRGTRLAANSRRSIRSAISGVLQQAILHGVITSNPCEHLEDIEGGVVKQPVAYTAKRVAAFFAFIDTDQRAAKTGFAALIRFLFLSGARIGEALAIRWCDLNVSDTTTTVTDPVAGTKDLPPHSMWINGNIVRVKGKGLVRHSGKTFRSQRILPMPEALRLLLILHKPADAADTEPLFPSGTGGWRCPNNTQTTKRRLAQRIKKEHPEFAEFADFTFHIGRKSAGTALKMAGHSDLAIADYLGKASIRDVQQTYFGRGIENPEAAADLDVFMRGGQRG